jgi:RNA methyltransferase, TrmH family
VNYINLKDTNIKELEIYHQLRDNAFKEDGSFIADSPKVVNTLLESGIEVKSILATKEYYEKYQELLSSCDIPVAYLSTKEQMQGIVGHKIHHNCMMHGVRKDMTPLDELDDQIIMLDAITSTENIGSIARSAAALGVFSYLVPSDAPHPYSRRALRVSMGHLSKLKYNIYEDIFETIKSLQKGGYKVFAAEVSPDAIKLQKVKVPQKWVLLMGHEGKGLSKEIMDVCDACVEIEMMEDVRSFNVGTAASILMYHFKMN